MAQTAERVEVEGRLLIGLFLLLVFAVTSGLAHALRGVLELARDGLKKALHFLNFTVFGKGVRLGDKLANGVTAIADPVIHALGVAAQASDAQVAKWFYGLARVLGEVFDAIEAVAMLTVSVAYFAAKGVYSAAVGAKIKHTEQTVAEQGKVVRDTRAKTAANTKAQGQPLSARISHTVAVAFRPLALRVARVEHATAVAIPGELEWLRERDRTLERAYESLRERIHGIGARTIGLASAAVTAVALSRLGASWIRCSNVKSIGRRLCGTDPRFLEDLLAGSLAIVGTISIVEFARELQGIVGEGAAFVHDHIREG